MDRLGGIILTVLVLCYLCHPACVAPRRTVGIILIFLSTWYLLDVWSPRPWARRKQ